jgi:hypothetical protein
MKQSATILTFFSALFYFLFTVFIGYSEVIKQLFIGLMMFLPGLTFPFASTNFYTNVPQAHIGVLILHCFLSVLIYHGAVWLYSGEGFFYLMPGIAGCLGSLLYLTITRYLLKVPVTATQIILTALCSGAAFIPDILTKDEIGLGAAIFFWTIINWFVVDRQSATTNSVFLRQQLVSKELS